MNDYSQPDFYRFNSDSFELINFIKKLNPNVKSILDIGAGSGVIGIEISRSLSIDLVVFVEAQKEFYEHLVLNCNTFIPQISREIIITKISNYDSLKKFDLIVSNPPYFNKKREEYPPIIRDQSLEVLF